MKITIKNNFHGTEARVRFSSLPATLTAGQIKRVRRALCGMTDCSCGGNLSERGPQDVVIEQTADGCGVRLEAI